ncbi:MAG: DUF6311 domain-containing protein [Clostridiales bacterium]|nr:DUF6311 domain-containing protein [Clostridiales bacterium]
MEKFKEITSTKRFIFIFCGILGALAYIAIYGVAFLNFTNTEWLIHTWSDLTQHYLGWNFFRNSDWHFPIGLMDNITYPFRESVLFTDSIPLFAVIFKLLSPILPENFQYFGLFGIICFFLQGAVAGLLLKRLCDNTAYSIIGSIFFILSTTMIFRMYLHTALAAHFIILLCIYFCVTKDDSPRSLKTNIFIWGGLAVLACVIHIYFVPMVLGFMAFYLLDDYLNDKNIVRPLIITACSIIVPLLVLTVLGAFYNSADPTIIGLRIFGANLLTFFHPIRGASAFLGEIPMVHQAQFEGSAYLGLGIIIGLLVMLALFIKRRFQTKKQKKKKKFGKLIFRRRVLISVFVAIFTILAISPVVRFADTVLFEYSLPRFIEDAWGIFRATGRFIWIPAYLLILAVIWKIKSELKINHAIAVLAVLLVVQIADLGGHYLNLRHGIIENSEQRVPLASSGWEYLAQDENLHHFFFFDNWITDNREDRASYYEIGIIALRNGMTTSDFYMARRDELAIIEHRRAERARILRGEARGDMVYLFRDFERAMSNVLYLYEIDHFVVGTKNPIESLTAMDFQDLLRTYSLGDEIALTRRSPFQFQGWSPPDSIGTFTDRREAVLAMNIDSENDLILFMDIFAMLTDAPVEIYINDAWLGRADFQIGVNSIRIPKEFHPDEKLEIKFRFTSFISPREMGLHAPENLEYGLVVRAFVIVEDMP